MSARMATATRLGFREQARRPLLLVLLVVVPFFFITRAIARTEATPRRVGLPGGLETLTTMKALHGASMVTITVAFLAALCGAFIMRSAQSADRRLIVAGFRPLEAIVPRMIVLAAATGLVLVVSLAVTALSFTPVSWSVFVLGNLLVGLTYACIGALAGAALGQLPATYLVLFTAMLGIGILQNPMFGDGTPGGPAYAFPDYGAGRLTIDAAFSTGFHAWGELALALGWLAALVAAVIWVLRRLPSSARLDIPIGGISMTSMSVTTAPSPETTVLHVGGLHYASEKTVVERALGNRPGVLAVEANPVAQTATVTFDPAQTSVADLHTWVEECGYHCAGQSVPGHVCDPMAEPDAHADAAHDPGATERADHAHGHGHGGHAGMSMEAMERDMRNRFLVALVFTIPIVLWSMVGTELLGTELATPFGLDHDLWQFLLSLPVVLYASSIFFTGALAALRNRTLDMMVLVAVAIGTGWLYSVAATFFIDGEVFYEAAGMLATFVLLGHWFEMRARGGANDAIRKLLDLAPPKAVVIRDGEPVEIPTAEVGVGDLLLIRPGSKVPVDAVVEEGESQVDESTVTGESLPVKKVVGDELIGATINKNGTLRARATKVGSDTALAQIVKLVQEAQNSKAPGQRLADRAAFWLVFVALIGGALTFAVWYFVVGRDVEEALLFAITVVVITCPDALGLATPTAIMVGTGLGAERGILFKHAMALEQAATLDTVVLDKTGTLTRGEPEVVAVATANGVDENEVLRLVAGAEGDSEHPLAEAIVKAAAARGLSVPRADSFEAVPGHGLIASVDGRRLAVGNPRLLEREGIDRDGLAARSDELAGQGRTSVQVAIDSQAAAVIAVADAPRETAADAIAALKELGVRPVMLSGDSRPTAERVAAELGIDEVIAEVLPGDKADVVKRLQAAGRSVAMVGDGVNDAPALAQADVGIAIGAGTDVAVETADAVLMRSDPLDVATAITISRGTKRKMHQNLAWAVGYNSLALPVAAGVFEPLGFVLRPEVGAISMAGSSIIVALNAVALKRLRLPDHSAS